MQVPREGVTFGVSKKLFVRVAQMGSDSGSEPFSDSFGQCISDHSSSSFNKGEMVR
jgi:hypothetical protein